MHGVLLSDKLLRQVHSFSRVHRQHALERRLRRVEHFRLTSQSHTIDTTRLKHGFPFIDGTEFVRPH